MIALQSNRSFQSDRTAWFERLLERSVDTIAPIAYLAELSQTSFLAVDDVSYAVLSPKLAKRGVDRRLIRREFVPLALSKDLACRRIVIIDSVNEEVARSQLRHTLIESRFPISIIETLEIVTFFADVLPAMIAQYSVTKLDFRSFPDFGSLKLYAIVSTPRSGSTFLGNLLRSIGLGNPIEHIRPWVSELFASRAPGLFDGIRFLQQLINFGRTGEIFGTKLISHVVEDILPSLTPEETSYLRELARRTKVIYLNRRSKLDQAISTLRAQKTGIWHSTDKAYQPAAYGAFPYDFDEIERTLAYYINSERKIAQLLSDCRDLIIIDYDELSSNPTRICLEIAEQLGVRARGEPVAEVEKLADNESQAMTSRFKNDAAHRNLPINFFVDTAELFSSLKKERDEQIAESERIRSGHARSRNGPYQDRHYHLIDYDCGEVPGIGGLWRGPRPRSLEPGNYLLFLGAAQTYGAYVAQPFAKQIGDRLGLDILNLSRGGVSPLFFSENVRICQLIQQARAIVVQTMAARMVPTSFFNSVGHMNLVHFKDDPTKTVIDSQAAWQRICSSQSPETIRSLVSEARAEWIASMKKIATKASGPTVLLWMSQRAPKYMTRYDDVFGLFGHFPQLVNDEMISEIRRFYTEYAEVVYQPEEEETRSAFSNAVLPVIVGGERPEEQKLRIVNSYYPTQAAHNSVTDVLLPVLSRLLQIDIK